MWSRKQNRSILFVCPDYHCSFLYRDQLRLRGWKADIYVPPHYPTELLYGPADIKAIEPSGSGILSVALRQMSIFLVFVRALVIYKYHFYHGRLDHFTFYEHRLPIIGKYVGGLRLHLAITRLCCRKIIYIPSGTPDEVTTESLRALGNSEEGIATESESTNRAHLSMVRRYSNANIGSGFVHTPEFSQVHLQYKALDLQRWKPDIAIPAKFLITRKKPTTVRVLHSFLFGTDRQQSQGGNIKGTKYVVEAVERLVAEGFDVELLSFDRVPSRDYIYYQAQADIVVEELIRGCWGSTAVECMALGKPVLTYIRPEWEKAYLDTFSSVERLPVLSTSKHSIYDNLRFLLMDRQARSDIGAYGRQFAERYFDVAKNVHSLEAMLLSANN